MAEVYQSSNAAKNIADVISAMSDAQKSQIDLKKAVMMKQIGDKQDLAMNAAKLHQGVQSNIEQKQANYSWANSLGGGDNSPQTQTNGLNDANRATNATAGTVGAQPMLPGQPQANPMAPTPMPQAQPQPTPSAMLRTPSPQAGGQPIVPPGTTQAPTNPMLNSPAAGTGGQPIMPPSVQYNNLGYKPVESQQLVQTRRANGENINMSDRAYVQALQKVKTGTATQGEIDMVHKMNNRTDAGIPQDHPAAQASNVKDGTAHFDTGTDVGIIKFPKPAEGLKSGALYVDPNDGDIKPNPFFQEQIKSMIDAKSHVLADQPNVDRARQDRLYNQAVTDIAIKQVSYRSGSIGTQDQKVSQAIHARQLINQAYDPKTGQYDVTQVPYGELAESLGNLLSGGTGSSEGRIAALKQKTAQGDLNGALTYITGKPSNATSQDALQQLVKMIDRQGITSEQIRDGDLLRLKHAVLDGSGLSEDSKQAMFNSKSVGASYSDNLKQSPDQQAPTNNQGTSQYQEGMTATNKQTGKKLTYRGGQWQ